MRHLTIVHYPPLAIGALLLGLLLFAIPVFANEATATTPAPGFRPQSEFSADFINGVGATRIAVLPSIVRRNDRTAHSFASQDQIIAFLNESGIATAVSKPRRIDLGPHKRPSQWEMFQYAAESIAAELEGYETGADYTLVMEFLVPDERPVFGIEVYIIDRQGRNAFSFLLNSHHRMFVGAKLFARDSSEAARQKMIEDATKVGLMALSTQIELANECITASAANRPAEAAAGMLHDFASELVSVTNDDGIPLGFSTFSDGNSQVSISRSTDHPAVPAETSGNAVLQLDLNVTGWAGFVSLFAKDEANTWVGQDWSKLDGFSFWLYGNHSGTDMFVDVMDNRWPCSDGDDAERYTYTFVDDVAGWRQISIPFTDMYRKEIGNGAPNDGLNLTEVHGWGLGALNTGGPRTYYLDNFRLWQSSTYGESAPMDVITHDRFVETRLAADTSKMVLGPDSGTGLAVEKVMDLSCALARLTTDRGYRYFRTDERARLSGGRRSFRITFYSTLPDSVPVASSLLTGSDTNEADLMIAAVDAEKFIEACELLESESQNRNRP